MRLAECQKNQQKLKELRSIHEERLELMARLAELPSDMFFYTQLTMEAAEDPEFLDAMRKARIKGALVGVEAATPEGLKRPSKISIALARTWFSGSKLSANMASMS